MPRSLMEPQLHPVALVNLRPSQMTIGFAEVAENRVLSQSLRFSGNWVSLHELLKHESRASTIKAPG